MRLDWVFKLLAAKPNSSFPPSSRFRNNNKNMGVGWENESKKKKKWKRVAKYVKHKRIKDQNLNGMIEKIKFNEKG